MLRLGERGLPMKGLRGALLALGAAIGAASACGFVVVGCGDDTSAAAPDSGGGDGTTDAAEETATDSAMDSPAETQGEAGTDADGGVVTTDAMPDAVETGAADADAGFVNYAFMFANQEATALCRAFLGCCSDAGTYDMQTCINNLEAYGWEGNLAADPAIYGRGNVAVDQTRAANCLTAIQSFPCGTQTPAQWGAITSACELVLTGTIAADAGGCQSSFECAPGTFCDPTVAGGVCTPLAAQGQRCNTKIDSTINPIPDYMCSYLGSGQPALFCDLVNNGPDAATCQPLLANGANCFNAATGYYDDQACTAPGLCGDNVQCGGTASYPYPATCALYAIQDAGGGG